MKRINIFLLSFNLFIALILLLLCINFYTYALLNLVRLKHIHKIADLNLQEKPLYFPFQKQSTLWRIALALAESGETHIAAPILFDIAKQQTISQERFQTIFPILIDAGLDLEAISLFDKLNAPFFVDPQIASLILLEHKRLQIPLLKEDLNSLLARALTLSPDSLELELLFTDSRQSQFWESTLGKNLSKTLEWRSKQLRFTRLSENDDAEIKLDAIFLKDVIRQILHVPPNYFSVGRDLINNGGFEDALCYPVILTPDFPPQYCTLHKWLPSFMVANGIWNRAIFAIGTDTIRFKGNYSVRIDGVNLDQASGLDPARAGIWYEDSILVEPNQPYVIRLAYRTQEVDLPAAALWMSNDPFVFFGGDIILPLTYGNWRYAYIIAWNRTAQVKEIKPLLRSFSTGNVWFDDFSIRPIFYNISVAPQEPIIFITS